MSDPEDFDFEDDDLDLCDGCGEPLGEGCCPLCCGHDYALGDEECDWCKHEEECREGR